MNQMIRPASPWINMNAFANWLNSLPSKRPSTPTPMILMSAGGPPTTPTPTPAKKTIAQMEPDERFAWEYSLQAAEFKRLGLSEADYIETRRIDWKLDKLQSDLGDVTYM